MQCIITALKAESQPLITYFKLVRNPLLDFPCYHNVRNNIYLIIVGVGKKNIQSRINNFHHFIDKSFIQYINFGIAGGKKDITNIGQIFLISKIVDEETGESFYPDILFKHEFMESSITTVSRPITDGGLGYQKLVDMESSEIHRTCSKFVPLHNIAYLKVISDYMDINIKKNLNVANLIHPFLKDFDLFLARFFVLKKVFNQLLSSSDLIWVKSVKDRLLLTQTQANQLKTKIKTFRIKNQNKTLPDYNLEKPKTKLNRNIHLQNIFEILTS